MLKSAALPAFGSLAALSLPKLAEAVQTNSTPYQRPKLKITDIRTAQVVVHGRRRTSRYIRTKASMGRASLQTPQRERWR